MTQRLRLLVPLLPLLFFPNLAAAEKLGAGRTATHNRIVFQINEDDTKTWNGVLGNIRNIQKELGAQNVNIAVVAIGAGVVMLTAESLIANGVLDAAAAGVRFVACGNSMAALHIEKSDLIDGVTVTPAGYVELMRLQQQGWTYLRP